MGKTVSKYPEEIEFFETYDANADLSDKEEDYLKYGFFHLTPKQNLKQGHNGTYAESIEQKGLIATIGGNSHGYEKFKRTYYSVGADGVCGLINRFFFLHYPPLMEQEGLDKDSAKKYVFSEMLSLLKNSIFLKLNLRNGIEYDNNDFLNRRNSHTITGVTVPPSQLALLSANGSNCALDIFKYFYEKANIAELRINAEQGEENLLHEFMEYVQEVEKANPNLGASKRILTPLKTLELGKQNENTTDHNCAYAK